MSSARELKIKDTKCSIHPSARIAYLFTSQIRFQTTREWADILGCNNIDLPWAIYNLKSQQYLVFAHWKSMLPQKNTYPRQRSILVWNDAPIRIDFVAWRYAATLLDSMHHRKSGLLQISRFISSSPSELSGALIGSAKSHSNEKLTQVFSDESRSSVKTQCKGIQHQNKGDD
jgi:hypothetical protein